MLYPRALTLFFVIALISVVSANPKPEDVRSHTSPTEDPKVDRNSAMLLRFECKQKSHYMSPREDHANAYLDHPHSHQKSGQLELEDTRYNSAAEIYLFIGRFQVAKDARGQIYDKDPERGICEKEKGEHVHRHLPAAVRGPLRSVCALPGVYWEGVRKESEEWQAAGCGDRRSGAHLAWARTLKPRSARERSALSRSLGVCPPNADTQDPLIIVQCSSRSSCFSLAKLSAEIAATCRHGR
ncbi:hypothetical protein WOLCODRAFT_19194 [Wolfiporia cocos MD-104 SS10]|uniref:Uncharacterized protein n=1 Tax=Wolfiporia cocos (strain MD-104) TaxID=742152 RepID=A0A2H3JTG0_WOLCO|nr:hypothetical protein WOLCODRAFT_19194 [Wolfiporia cocos MD-104 SS10]